MKLVSIIIPLYNGERFVLEAVESALAQTYPSVEVIVVDDGSTDGGKALLAPYVKTKRIRYFEEPHRGLPAARNKGIRVAKGEYIAFLDADDIFLPEKIERQAAYLDAHPECEAVYSALYHFWEDDPETLLTLRYRYYSGRDVFPQLLRRFFIAPSTVVIRKDVLERRGGFSEDIPIAEDFEFWLRLTHRGVCVGFLPTVLAKLRMRRTGNIQTLTNQPEMKRMTLKGLLRVADTMSAADRKRYRIAWHLFRYRLLLAFAYFLIDEKRKAREQFFEAFSRWHALGVLLWLPFALVPTRLLGVATRGLYHARRAFYLRRVNASQTGVVGIAGFQGPVSSGRASPKLVSVLIPAYNAAAYIRETVVSALAQTYPNIEVLVADDGSTDATGEIVKGFKDPRIRYFRHENRGIAKTRNRLFREAKGEYLAILDSDDMYLPRKVEAEVAFLESHPEYAAVYCDLRYFFDGAPGRLYRHRYTFPSGNLFRELLKKQFITNTTLMLRRSVIETIGVFNEDTREVEDWSYFLKMARAGMNIGFLPLDLVRFRLRWDNNTRFEKQLAIQWDALDIFERLKKDLSPAEREEYRIDALVGNRKLRVAALELANGNRARGYELFSGVRRHPLWQLIAWLVWPLFFLLPVPFIRFALEKIWNFKKRNLFVPAA